MKVEKVYEDTLKIDISDKEYLILSIDGDTLDFEATIMPLFEYRFR
jgi:hypothetical protein